MKLNNYKTGKTCILKSTTHFMLYNYNVNRFFLKLKQNKKSFAEYIIKSTILFRH